MTTKTIKIGIPTGLEPRPVALLVQVASQYESSVYLEAGSVKVNAKSIMGMMTLGLAADVEVNVIVDGPDETMALKGIEDYLSGKN